jgi:adenosine deaminase
MLDIGLRATCNSDDPAYFGGYIADNFIRTADAVGLTRDDVIQLAKNSFTGSFLGGDEVAKHIASIDAYAATC